MEVSSGNFSRAGWAVTTRSDGFFLVRAFENSSRVVRFINPKVYSELDEFLLKKLPYHQYESEEPLFWSRYRNWTDACLNLKKNFDCKHQKFELRLPNPYNKGHDSLPEAIEAIKAHITRFEDIQEWRIFWSSFRVFRNNEIILLTSFMNASWTKCLTSSSCWDCDLRLRLQEKALLKRQNFRLTGFEDDSRREVGL